MEGTDGELKIAMTRLAWIAKSMGDAEEAIHRQATELLAFCKLCGDSDARKTIIQIIPEKTEMLDYLAEVAERQKLRIEIEIKERELQKVRDKLDRRGGE